MNFPEVQDDAGSIGSGISSSGVQSQIVLCSSQISKRKRPKARSLIHATQSDVVIPQVFYNLLITHSYNFFNC